VFVQHYQWPQHTGGDKEGAAVTVAKLTYVRPSPHPRVVPHDSWRFCTSWVQGPWRGSVCDELSALSL